MAKPSKPKKPKAPWRQARCFLAWASTVNDPRGFRGPLHWIFLGAPRAPHLKPLRAIKKSARTVKSSYVCAIVVVVAATAAEFTFFKPARPARR
eukprot:9486082-Pyramimonas_sp.AAC.1